MNNYQKPSLSIPDRVTGEILNFCETSSGVYEKIIDPLVYAALRWRLKYAVRKILGPSARPCKCHRWRLPSRQVEVMRSNQNDSCFYGGLEVCSSVWLCPLCAAKISQRRVEELNQALETARSLGYWPQLLTLTFPHGAGKRLSTILKKLLKAFSDRLLSGRSGTFLRDNVPFVGLIRSLEVTYGQNGWHPHLHVLVFSTCELPLPEQQKIWFEKWFRACLSVGLPAPHPKHGCDLQNGHAAGSYVSKWGLAQELAKSHVKSGKLKGASPWDMLRIVSGDSWDGMPDMSIPDASRLWLEYSKCFKGQRQLFWTRGLKKLFLIEEQTDQEVNEREDDTAVALYMISQEEWSWILSARAEVDVLSVARDCPDALPDFIESLKTLDNYETTDSEIINRFSHRPGSSAYCPF